MIKISYKRKSILEMKPKKKEDDYDTLVQSFMLEKHLALSTMDYMDDECDNLAKKEAKEKSQSPRKVKRKHFKTAPPKESIKINIIKAD